MTNETLQAKVQEILAEQTGIRFGEYRENEQVIYSSKWEDGAFKFSTKGFPEDRSAYHKNTLVGAVSTGDFAAAIVDVFAERGMDGNSHKDLYFLLHLPSNEVVQIHEDGQIQCGWDSCPYKGMELRVEGNKVELDVTVDYGYTYDTKDTKITFTREFKPTFAELKEKSGIGQIYYHK
jgi:hypothetical protein